MRFTKLYQILIQNRQRISELPINKSGISTEGIPFVELNSGRIFYGYPPTPRQRYFYRIFIDRNTKVRLKEECINVAWDIVKRYLEPTSREEYLGQGKFYGFKAGNIVVEVGAYIGYFTMRASELVGRSGRVVAIEAINDNFELLKKNVEANSLENVSIIPKGAWSSTCTLRFYRHNRQEASAIPTVVTSQNEISVPCDTVDNILKSLDINKLDFVRIQVNGAEKEVLNGMTEILKHFPKLLIAANYKINRQKSWMEIERFLKCKGYSTLVEGGNVFAKND